MVARNSRIVTGALAAALVFGLAAAPAFAADATLKQVYDQAKSGDIDGALASMGPVLKDHPNSAKAHYVEAELLARANRIDDARGELAKAKSIAPGLPGISSHSVSELEAKLNHTAVTTTAMGAPGIEQRSEVRHESSIPWGLIIVVGLFVFGILALMRRRSPPAYAPGYGGTMGVPPASGYGPGPGYAPGYAPGYGAPPAGGGMGGGLLGGLAQGAAMGAGFAAGEEVIGHMFGGEHERPVGGVDSSGDGGRRSDPDADMGGNDFGVSDGGSWDDSGSGGGDSGGDGW